MDCIKCGISLPVGALYCPACGKKQTATKRAATRSKGNGEGSVYKDGSSWCAAAVIGWKLGDNGQPIPVRRKKKGFKTKKEASAYLPNLRNKAEKRAPTISELWETYNAGDYKKLSESKKTAYRIAFSKMDRIQYTKIDVLTVGDLQRMIDIKAPTYYPAKDMRDLLSHFYKLAMYDQFVLSNLALVVSLPAKDETIPNPFSPLEQAAIWKDYAAGHREAGYILLMIYTGMMPGELLQAKKDMIDWDSQEIIGAGKKTKKRRSAPIVLADIIVPVLRDLCDSSQGDSIVPVSRDKFYELFYETLDRAGCRSTLKPYSCRHTTATALAEADIQPSIIQQVMRHAKFSSTQRYIHISDPRAKEAVNKIAVGEQ